MTANAIPARDWRAPPSSLSTASGQLDIWLLELDKTPCEPAWLDSTETTRLKNFRLDAARQQYCSAHTALRTILGRYLNCAPAGVPLIISPGGKPRINDRSLPIHFNLSHADNSALLAVRSGQEIGVDIENRRDLPNVEPLARRIFQDRDIALLLQSGWDKELFLALWTHMEARQKCLGRGVFGEAVDENEAESTSLILKANQCAAIAWPTGTAPNTINFYHAPPGLGL